MIATGARLGRSSSAVNARPRIGPAPTASKKSADTRAPRSSSGSPAPVNCQDHERKAARRSNDWASAFRPRKFAAEFGSVSEVWANFGKKPQIITTRSGSVNGKARNNVAFTTLKIAVFAPIPSANVNTATTEKPGRFNNARDA